MFAILGHYQGSVGQRLSLNDAYTHRDSCHANISAIRPISSVCSSSQPSKPGMCQLKNYDDFGVSLTIACPDGMEQYDMIELLFSFMVIH